MEVAMIRFSRGLAASNVEGILFSSHTNIPTWNCLCTTRIPASLGVVVVVGISFMAVSHAINPLELILTQQWSEESYEGPEAYKNDVEYAQDSILSDPDVASPTIASTSALLKWIGHKEYIDVAEEIRSAYQLLDPKTLSEGLSARTQILSESPEDWVGWINAGLAAQALGDPQQAFLYFDNAIQCPNCVDSPGLRVLRGKSLLEAGDVKTAHLEYILAATMAIQTQDPSFLFRIRQSFADDFYDHGYLDEAVKRGYICMDSEYPLETCWALGLEIVYKWSNDDLPGVAESVSRLSTLLPVTVPNPDSDWERRRFEQTSFLHSTAEKALAGDQLSRMILDVEATEFHYKRGEVYEAIERLEPWLQAYPTNLLPIFSPEEQDWALWVKHNYALILSGMNRNKEAETLLSEIVNSVDSQQHPAHVVRSWCTLGRCYWLEGNHQKAIETIERGLDIDAENTSFIPPGSTDLRMQPRLRDARLEPDVRAGMVVEYQILKSRLEGE